MSEKNNIEFSVSMTKTIQEKQFEPMVISASMKMEIPEDHDIQEEVDRALDFLEETIEKKFKSRGVM
jgi:hypothetical protein